MRNRIFGVQNGTWLLVLVLFAITVAITAITGEPWKFYFSILVIATIPLFDRWVFTSGLRRLLGKQRRQTRMTRLLPPRLSTGMQRLSIPMQWTLVRWLQKQDTNELSPGFREMIPKFIG
jgi:uncharacterized membrane protein